MVISLLSMEGQRALGFHQKYHNLCSEDELKFGTEFSFLGELTLLNNVFKCELIVQILHVVFTSSPCFSFPKAYCLVEAMYRRGML